MSNNETSQATSLQPMVFKNHQITPIIINELPYFIANEVCNALAIGNSRDAMSRLDEDERRVSVVPTPSGKQSVNLVSESGLYSLIFQSRKPEAKAFKKWVTSEVLPAIRKTGSYGIHEVQNLSTIESGITALIGAVTNLTEAFTQVTTNMNERITRLEKLATEAPTNTIAITRPKVVFIDARNQEYDFVRINHNSMRRITIDEVIYYSINDFCQAIGANTGAWQIARKLNRNRSIALKIWVFGNTHPAWFTTKNGLRLMVSGSQKLKNDNNIKLELRRI